MAEAPLTVEVALGMERWLQEAEQQIQALNHAQHQIIDQEQRRFQRADEGIISFDDALTGLREQNEDRDWEVAWQAHTQTPAYQEAQRLDALADAAIDRVTNPAYLGEQAEHRYAEAYADEGEPEYDNGADDQLDLYEPQQLSLANATQTGGVQRDLLLMDDRLEAMQAKLDAMQAKLDATQAHQWLAEQGHDSRENRIAELTELLHEYHPHSAEWLDIQADISDLHFGVQPERQPSLAEAAKLMATWHLEPPAQGTQARQHEEEQGLEMGD